MQAASHIVWCPLLFREEGVRDNRVRRGLSRPREVVVRRRRRGRTRREGAADEQRQQRPGGRVHGRASPCNRGAASRAWRRAGDECSCEIEIETYERRGSTLLLPVG